MNNVAKKSASATEPFFRSAYSDAIPAGRTPSAEIRRQAAWLALYTKQQIGEDDDATRDFLEIVDALMRASLEVEALETSVWHARVEHLAASHATNTTQAVEPEESDISQAAE